MARPKTLGVNLSIAVSEEDAARLDSACAEDDRDRSYCVREALREWLDRRDARKAVTA